MKKTILITGSTDGIGLATAKMLAIKGHNILLHGRNVNKLEEIRVMVEKLSSNEDVNTYLADLSNLKEVEVFAKKVIEENSNIDVLINNAGVYKTANTITSDGMDIRFVVNTIAPYLLTRRLLPILHRSGRVINLSSAAQSSVDLDALAGKNIELSDMEAYSQSKLAILMWTRDMADSFDKKGPVIIAVNPGSLLGSKMVKEGFGIEGHDINIGAKILTRLALDNEFIDASGQYFDNDKGQFSMPIPDALDSEKCREIVNLIDSIVSNEEK